MGKDKGIKAANGLAAKVAAPVVNGKAAGSSKKDKKAKKAPTPPPPPPPAESSDESSESDSDSEGSSSGSDSESEKEKAPVVVAKATAAKASGKAAPTPAAAKKDKKAPAPAPVAESSDESTESESENEKKPAVVAKMANGAKAESDSSDDDSDGSDDEKAPAATKAAPAKKTDDSDSGSDSDSSESSEDEDEDEDVKMKDAEEKPAAGVKRKAENGVAAPAKKAKLDGQAADAEPESNTVFVGQLSWNVDNDWLKSEFEQFGAVVAARVATDRDSGRSRGFGHVEFETVEAAKAACARNGTEIDGRAVKVNMAMPGKSFAASPQKAAGGGNGGYKGQNEGGEATKTLFVGNLPWSITEDQLWETFGEFASVSAIRLPTDRETGKVKGFGYVEFGSVEDAKKAYDGAAGTEYEGRAINLDYSRPRDPAGGGDRGGRGGARGGRGGFRGGADGG